MIAPAFSRSFYITEAQRISAGCRIVVGDWSVAKRALTAGRKDVLAVPPGEVIARFDWSMLRHSNVVVLAYEQTDAVALIARLRSYGVRDIALMDYSVNPPRMLLAPTMDTLEQTDVSEVAYD